MIYLLDFLLFLSVFLQETTAPIGERTKLFISRKNEKIQRMREEAEQSELSGHQPAINKQSQEMKRTPDDRLIWVLVVWLFFCFACAFFIFSQLWSFLRIVFVFVSTPALIIFCFFRCFLFWFFLFFSFLLCLFFC